MAYLIGSSDVSAYTTDTTYNTNEFYAWRNGDTTVGVVASSSGTVNKINMYIANWNAMTSIKACLYEDNALLNSVVVPASIGTGFVSFAFPDTAVVAGSEKYKLAFYLVNGDSTLTLKTKTGDGQYREAVGSYTSPAATIGDGNWFGAQEFYWSAESGSAVTIDDEPTDVRVTESRTIRVTAPTTAMTAGNTTVKINSSGNSAITPSAVTNISGLTYDVVFTVTDEYAGLPYSATGYGIIVATADGSVTSSNVPFLPDTGNDYVTLTDVSATDIESSPALEVADQVEWTNAAVIDIDSEGKVTSSEASATFEFRVWDHDDSTWGDWSEATFGDAEPSDGGGITSAGLTSAGITSAGLTRSGLSS